MSVRLTVAVLCLFSIPAWALDTPVRTAGGLVSGLPGRDASVAVFKGIPYAAPPVGELRWKPPQPAASWQGVRKAEQFGDTCAQPSPRNATAQKMSEDCLTLNIWTAAKSATDKRPVLFWIYGGGYMGGSTTQPTYDGEALARQGIVVVTVNYRVGPFGFLALPQLTSESAHHASGNYGLLDMIEALRWVQRNISAFGGDPSRVTIAGQSSGGGSVLLLAQSPLAKGLFRAGISESGPRAIGDPIFPQDRPLADNERRGARFAAAHGAPSLQELRALSWQQVLEGVAMDNADPGDDGDASLPVFRPTIDGWVLPLSVRDAYAQGTQHDIPIMAGFNLDEMGAEPHAGLTLTGLREASERSFSKQGYSGMGEELLKLYPATDDAHAEDALRTAARDHSRATTYFWASAWRQKTHANLYLYFFTHAPPGPRGVYHGAEIAYAFDSLDSVKTPWTEQDHQVAQTLSSYWVNFVLHGDPNGAGLAHWPAFDGKPEVMVLGDRWGTMPVAEPVRLDFMKRFFASQKPF